MAFFMHSILCCFSNEKWTFFIFFLLFLDIFIKNDERDILYQRSEDRFDHMLSSGAIEEVESLMKKKYNEHNSIMKAIGVRELANYLNGIISLDECKVFAKQKTRNYIKRQLTWIRSNNITQNIDIKKYI